MDKILESCTLCPRRCKVNREAGKRGYCSVDARVVVARAALHMWEEPCISGERGSGAVFFLRLFAALYILPEP
jgi:putative pyruvate formate lyase activating enzyme